MSTNIESEKLLYFCLQNNIKFQWNRYSKNPYLSVPFLEKNINEKWDFSLLSENPAVPLNIILKYPNKKWDKMLF